MKKKLVNLCFFWITPIILLFIYYFLNKTFSFSIPCIIHKVTHLYCPTCGITRLLFSLLNGNIYRAFRYNQLVFILIPMIIIYLIILSYLYLTDKINDRFKKISKNLFFIVLVLLISFGIIRNITYFSFLRP